MVWVDAIKDEARCENQIILAGERARSRISSAFVAAGDESYEVSITITHLNDNTSSNMLTRSALKDRSAGVYRGTIMIAPNAKGCDAYQREDTLLIGDNPKMDAKPILEINNNEVKCSHGVAIGRVDEEKLFYMTSRGIREEDAEMMIVEGFFDPMIIGMGENGKELKRIIQEKLLSK